MHPRKTTSGGRRRPLELDDVAGTGAALWNAELVLGMERVADGRAQLRVLKDRDGGIGQGVEIDLAFERGVGFTLAPLAAPMPRASKRPARVVAGGGERGAALHLDRGAQQRRGESATR
jgi:hypothetical protein